MAVTVAKNVASTARVFAAEQCEKLKAESNVQNRIPFFFFLFISAQLILNDNN